MRTIPEGFHTVTPYLIVTDGNAAIDTYVAAFDAREEGRILFPGTTTIMHACLTVGDSKLFLCDENPEQGKVAPRNTAGGALFYVYFNDVDAQHRQAVAAGLQEISPPEDMFWGDRMSMVRDVFGHTWHLATHVRDVSEAEMADAVAQMAQ